MANISSQYRLIASSLLASKEMVWFETLVTESFMVERPCGAAIVDIVKVVKRRERIDRIAIAWNLERLRLNKPRAKEEEFVMLVFFI